MGSDINFLQDVSDKEIATSRIFDLPKESVYQAWITPTLLETWWGPRGFTSSTHEHDLRPGGKWTFTMHGPNNMNFDNICEFVEIVPNKKIVWKHVNPPVFYVISTFDDVGTPEKSKCTFRMFFETAKECAQIKTFALAANEENFDKLDEILGSDLKVKAQKFQQLVVAGNIDEAYEKYIAPNMRHHNAYSKGDRQSLLLGMKENHQMFPHKTFTTKKIVRENDHVTTFSHILLNPGDKGIAVMHIFRFENGKIAEIWDMGAPVPENSLNENGIF